MSNLPIFGRVSLLSGCLRGQVSQKVLQQRLHTALDCWLSILTLIRGLCLFCFIFLLWFCLPLEIDAHAQAECDDPNTPEHEQCTNTPTRESLFKTPTPAPTKNIACPSGTPVGWLTLTPDPLWMLNCAECIYGASPITATMTAPAWLLTSTPGYSLTQTAILTNTATVTPNATETPTITPTSYNQFYTQYLGQSSKTQCDFPAWPTWGYYYGSTVTIDNYSSTNMGHFYRIVVDNGAGDRNTAFVKTSDETAKYGNAWSSGDYTIWAGVTNSSQDAKNYITGLDWVPDNADISTNYIYWGGSAKAGVRGRTSGACSTITVDVWMVKWGIPPTATPTPTGSATVTPTATGTVTPLPTDMYCAYVDGYLPGEGDDYFSDMIPNITLGETQCMTLIPAIDIDLSAVPWLPDIGIEAIQTNGVQLCMQSIEFGVIRIFQQEWNLDLIATMMLAILGIRLVLRS